jgi:hypothetical protein
MRGNERGLRNVSCRFLAVFVAPIVSKHFPDPFR